eukprot:411785-Prymnesium_polylepis.2
MTGGQPLQVSAETYNAIRRREMDAAVQALRASHAMKVFELHVPRLRVFLQAKLEERIQRAMERNERRARERTEEQADEWVATEASVREKVRVERDRCGKAIVARDVARELAARRPRLQGKV